MHVAFLTGFFASLGLILAIGAQNAFVLKQGLRKEHVLPVVLVCGLSDALAMTLGISGFGLVIAAFPWVDPAMRYGGAAFLLFYGAKCFYAAFAVGSGLSPADAPPRSLALTLSTCLALTWLNPHFYLDTMVLIGTLSTRYPGHQPVFAAGAITASFLFFFALGFGARLLRPVLASPRSWRILDSLIGAVMWFIAGQLILHQ